MKITVFGLSISSSWGNGHATLWRGLVRALHARGHEVVFFERDTPYYAANRDLTEIPGGRLVLYADWSSALSEARRELAGSDVAMVTSYCPDGIDATALVLDSSVGARVFYDLDTPVTLADLKAGRTVGYVGPAGFAGFDLVLSYTGGKALDELRDRLGARRVAPLYGHVDPQLHRPEPPVERFRADLSYIGTYAQDRQRALEALFIEPARRTPDRSYVIAGAQYPQDFPWTDNIRFVRHLPPDQHPAFYGSSRLTLNVTRAAMADMGWCPSARLFEAASCGCPLLSDRWEGLDAFFEPGREILVADGTEDAMAVLDLSDGELRAIAAAARERTLDQHTADRRAEEMLRLLDACISAPSGAQAVPGSPMAEV
jgi:spore maturation protein CgeB